jgi:hypothetical protein
MSDQKPAPQVILAGNFTREPFNTPQLTAAQMDEAAKILQASEPGLRLEDCLRTVQARARRIEQGSPKAAGYRAWFASIGIQLTGS